MKLPPVALFLVLGLGISACAGEVPIGREEPAAEEVRETASEREDGPFIRVLGTAQDGGLPHAACSCTHCRAARHEPERRRLIAGLAIVLPESGAVYLIDATPDIREQIDLLNDVRSPPEDRVDRAPVTGIFLTHAHIGHYLGLSFLGFEAVHTNRLPVWTTTRMAGFLRDNGPWSQLVKIENIDLRTAVPGMAVDLGEGVSVTSIEVPHRDEFSDTVGYLVAGPRRSVLYIPDTDPWRMWSEPAADRVGRVDVALLDGSFYSAEELPGRDVDEIRHPLIVDSMDLFQEMVDGGSTRVVFTHLNHSNPALVPEGPELAEIERRGFSVAAEGEEIEL